MKYLLLVLIATPCFAHPKAPKYLDAYLFCEKGDRDCITLEQDHPEPIRVQMNTKVKLQVESAVVESGDSELLLHLNADATRQFYKLTKENIGKRLVVAYGRSVGIVTKIQAAIEGGNLVLKVENLLDRKEKIPETAFEFCKKLTPTCTKATK